MPEVAYLWYKDRGYDSSAVWRFCSLKIRFTSLTWYLILTLILTLAYPFSTSDPDPNRNSNPSRDPDPKPHNPNAVALANLSEFGLQNSKIALRFQEFLDCFTEKSPFKQCNWLFLCDTIGN